MFFAENVILQMMALETGADVIAPFAVRLLKSCIKADPEGMNNTFANMFAIYDPSAASESLYRFIVTYALLGAKRPAKDIFEHDDMESLANAILSRSGRKELKDVTGGIDAWLAGGHRTPPAIIADFERKRLSWRAPDSNRSTGYASLGRY